MYIVKAGARLLTEAVKQRHTLNTVGREGESKERRGRDREKGEREREEERGRELQSQANGETEWGRG